MRFWRGILGTERGSTLVENLILTAAIAAIALPIVVKIAGDRTTRNLNANRGKLVGFIAQNRKQRVPNPWFSAEPIPTSDPGDTPRKPPSGDPPDNENPNRPPEQNTADNAPPSAPPFTRNNPTGSEDPIKSPNPSGRYFGSNEPGSVPNSWTAEGSLGQSGSDSANAKSAFDLAGSTGSQRAKSGDGGSDAAAKAASRAGGSDDQSVSGNEARLANKKAKDLADLRPRQRGLGGGSPGGGPGGGSDFDWWFLLRFLLVLLIILILIWFLFADMKRRT